MTARKLKRGNRSEVQRLLDEVVRVVRAHINEKHLRMYLFGSWAQGSAVSASDLDVALDTGSPIEPATIQEIADALDELATLRKIDIVDLGAVDSEFRERVILKGERIYGK